MNARGGRVARARQAFEAFSQQPQLLLPALVAALVGGLVYAAQARGLLAVVHVTPAPRHWLLFGAYAVAVLAGAGCLAAAAAAAVRARSLGHPVVLLLLLLQAALVVGAIVDCRLYAAAGFHIYDQAVRLALATSETRVNPATVRSIALTFAVVAALYLAVALVGRALVSRLAERGRRAIGLAAMALALGGGLAALLLAGSVNAAGEGPALSALFGHTPLFGGNQPNLDAVLLARQRPPRRPVGVGPATPARRYPEAARLGVTLKRRENVLLVVLESFRWDLVSDALTPNIARFSRSPGCLRSQRHYSSATVTHDGLFSLLYGLDAYRYSTFSRSGARSVPLALLRQSGYRLLWYSATRVRGWFALDFIADQFDDFREYRQRRLYRRDAQLLRDVRAFAASASKRSPFLLMATLVSTHHNYDYPPRFARDKPVLPLDYDHFRDSRELARQRGPIVNRYRNAARYVDHVFGEIVRSFAGPIARGELTVILTGDHAEEFWEDGLLGHSSLKCIDQRARVPFLFCSRRLSGAELPWSRHVDVMPSLIAHLGARPALPASRYSHGRSLLVRRPPEPAIASSERPTTLCLFTREAAYRVNVLLDRRQIFDLAAVRRGGRRLAPSAADRRLVAGLAPWLWRRLVSFIY